VSSTLCKAPCWPKKLMTYDANMTPLLGVQAGSRSGSRHCRAKAQRSVAGAAAFRATVVEVTAPRSNGWHRQAPAPVAGPGAQVRQPAHAHASQPALHVNMWLDFKQALAKSSTSSKWMVVDQGGSGAADSGQRRKEDRYTLDLALDQPCKFHSTPGRESTHSTR
jgi:hypothetical protein